RSYIIISKRWESNDVDSGMNKTCLQSRRVIGRRLLRRRRNDDPICAIATCVPALQIDPMDLSTFQMPPGNLIAHGLVPTSHTGITRPDFQSFNRSRSIDGTTKIPPIFGQRFEFERPKNWTIQIDRKTMATIEMTNDWLLWKAIVAGQADESAIFGFTTEQWAVLQKDTIGFGTIHVRICLCLESKAR